MNTIKSKERLEYIDILRGFSMILVVYCHVLGFGSPNYPGSSIDSFMLSFRMPMFFFISGVVSYNCGLSMTLLTSKILKKIRMQLMPTVVFLSLFIFVQNLDFTQSVIDSYKQGYWFTYVSFQVFCIYMFISFWGARFNKYGILTIFIAILSIVFFKLLGNKDNIVVSILSFDKVLYFLPYFCAGILFKKYKDVCHCILNNNIITALLFVISVQPFFYHTLLGTMFINLARVIFVYYIFWISTEKTSNINILNKCKNTFSYIGSHTIEIYLIHYFLLFKLPNSIELFLLENMNSSTKLGDFCWWLPELSLILPFTLLIVSICLLIAKLISFFPLINYICFGKK